MTSDNLEGAFLYASILALFYLIAISFRRRKPNISDVSFRIIILALCIEVFVEWLFFTGLIRTYPHFMRVNSPFVMILPSAFYLCISAGLSGRERFVWSDLIHLFIFLFFVVYLTPFYISSAEEKIKLYEVYLRGIRVDSLPTASIYRAAQFFALIGIVFQLSFRRIPEWGTKVTVISVAYIFLWAMDFYKYFSGLSGSGRYDGYYLISFLLLIVYLELIGAFDRRYVKYTTSGMSKYKAEELALKTQNLIETEKLFMNPKLSLADLAVRLEVHHNYVSQAINGHFKVSFKDLINTLRVEEAKKLLLDESHDRLTFEAIAEKAGFNSVSGFNSSFKKIVGCTPSAYKRTHTG